MILLLDLFNILQNTFGEFFLFFFISFYLVLLLLFCRCNALKNEQSQTETEIFDQNLLQIIILSFSSEAIMILHYPSEC